MCVCVCVYTHIHSLQAWSSLLSMCTPRYLSSSTVSTLTPWIETRTMGDLVLLRSTTSVLVFFHVVQNTRWGKVTDDSPVLWLLPSSETSNCSWIIRDHLKVTGHWPPAEVCSLDGEEEGRKYSSLRCPSVTDHTVWHTALQAQILWSATQTVNNPGHEGTQTCFSVSFYPAKLAWRNQKRWGNQNTKRLFMMWAEIGL